MAHVEDRWFKGTGKNKTPTSRNGKGKRYRVRYLDPDGVEKSQSFADGEKRAADAYAASVETDVRRGLYIDPKAGNVTFKKYALAHGAGQVRNPSTREGQNIRLNNHILPVFGAKPISAIKPSMVQAWVAGMRKTMAPNSVRAILGLFSSIMSAAVDDELIAKNPCKAASVKRPKKPEKKVTPWPKSTVDLIAENTAERYRLMVTIGAGCGLRQGEIFGLSIEDVDFDAEVLHVRRQVKILDARHVFGLPKNDKARWTPLPRPVAAAIREHIQRWPPHAVTLPWVDTHGVQGPVTHRLLLTSREGKVLNRNYINPFIWKKALELSGVPSTRENGMHSLRHWFASALLHEGVSIREVAEFLGHADPGFTLRIYTHLMPESAERARVALDRALRGELGELGSGPSLGRDID